MGLGNLTVAGPFAMCALHADDPRDAVWVFDEAPILRRETKWNASGPPPSCLPVSQTLLGTLQIRQSLKCRKLADHRQHVIRCPLLMGWALLEGEHVVLKRQATEADPFIGPSF